MHDQVFPTVIFKIIFLKLWELLMNSLHILVSHWHRNPKICHIQKSCSVSSASSKTQDLLSPLQILLPGKAIKTKLHLAIAILLNWKIGLMNIVKCCLHYRISFCQVVQSLLPLYTLPELFVVEQRDELFLQSRQEKLIMKP